MKNLLLLASFAMLCLGANAQKIVSGSLSPVKNAEKINFVVDYSKTSFNGKNEAAFSEYEEDWQKDKPEVIDYILAGVRDNLKGKISFGEFADAEYTLTIYPIEIERKGDTEAEATITDKQGNVICSMKDFEGEGGTFGTKLNLIKDGAKELGQNVGKFLKKQIRKAK